MSGIWKRNHRATAPDLDSTLSRGFPPDPAYDVTPSKTFQPVGVFAPPHANTPICRHADMPLRPYVSAYTIGTSFPD
jgi:hypothetical protein